MILAAATLLLLPQAPAPAPALPAEAEKAARYGERWTPEARVFDSAGPAVVSIDVAGRARARRTIFQTIPEQDVSLGQGTGVVIDPSGLVITNAHVADPPVNRGLVEGTMRLRVTFSDEFGGRSYPATLLNTDFESDLALLKIDGDGPFRAVPMGSSADLIVGEPVIAIGTPFGNSHSITSGILSGRHRDVTVGRGTGARSFSDLLQTDAAINPGNSGGPLLNVHGELVGINFATNLVADNIGFAIPVDRVREIFAERLLNVDRSDKFWAGMTVEETWQGLTITRIHPRGPAYLAGLRQGDRLLEVDGEAVLSVGDYAARLLVHQPREEIGLGLQRAGETFDASFRLMPAEARDKVGLLGFDAEPDLVFFRRGSVREAVKVLRVTRVYPGTGAERLGIEPGDAVLAVKLGGLPEEEAWRPVRGMAELVALLRGPDFAKQGENLWLLREDQAYRGELVLDDPTVYITGG